MASKYQTKKKQIKKKFQPMNVNLQYQWTNYKAPKYPVRTEQNGRKTDSALPIIIRKKLKRKANCFRHVWS